MQVLVRDNNVDQALRVLKKKMQREGIFRELKQRRAYEKPSERKTREKAEAIRRARKLARKKAQREGLIVDRSKKKPLDGRGRTGGGGAGGPARRLCIRCGGAAAGSVVIRAAGREGHGGAGAALSSAGMFSSANFAGERSSNTPQVAISTIKRP